MLGCVRADFSYGGFFIAPAGGPTAPSSRSIVMHVLDLDLRGWATHCCGTRADVHFFLLGRVAGEARGKRGCSPGGCGLLQEALHCGGFLPLGILLQPCMQRPAGGKP